MKTSISNIHFTAFKSICTFFICLNSFISFAQNTNEELTKDAKIYRDKILKLNPTTDQEYIYATNGISASISNALDVKNGYTINGKKNFEDLQGSDFVQGQYDFRFATLKREADNSVAGIIVKLVSDYHKKTFWFCIPIGNEELMKKFRNTLSSSLGEDSSTAFAFALIQYLLSAKLLESSFTDAVLGTNGQSILSGFGLSPEEANSIQSILK